MTLIGDDVGRNDVQETLCLVHKTQKISLGIFIRLATSGMHKEHFSPNHKMLYYTDTHFQLNPKYNLLVVVNTKYRIIRQSFVSSLAIIEYLYFDLCSST